jgi:hypothetical protein
MKTASNELRVCQVAHITAIRGANRKISHRQCHWRDRQDQEERFHPLVLTLITYISCVKRRRRFLILVAVCGVALTILLASSGEREPEYKGQTLTYWLKKNFDDPSEDESSTAIRQIGTYALPWLTKWIVYEPSKTKRRSLDFAEELPVKLRRPLQVMITGDRMWAVRHELAIVGFRELGPQASSAVPELVQALVRGKGMFGYPLTPALVAIGDDSIPPIVNVMTNLAYPKDLRIHAVYWLGSLRTGNSLATSNLVACIQKQEPEVGLASAGVLASSRLEVEVVLPFLTNLAGHANSLIRKNVASCIGAYGPKARSAVPILLQLQKDSLLDVRVSATNAVFRIDPTLLPPGTRPPQIFIE